MPIRFLPIPTDLARVWRADAPDAYGNPPERETCPAHGAPCRHCLDHVPVGTGMLILAHSSFGPRQPYAETSPIFLCADDCPAFDPARGVPPTFQADLMLIRAYGGNERILYGTGAVVAPDALSTECAARLVRPAVAFVHVRSSTNNCFQARVERAA